MADWHRQMAGQLVKHRALRKSWAPRVNAGLVDCARCGKRIVPDPTQRGDGWHLDHSDDRSSYLGPSCASCNMSAGGTKATMQRKTSPAAKRKRWVL